MDSRLAKDELFKRKTYPLLYLAKRRETPNKNKLLHSRQGIPYVIGIIALFVLFGILFNIVLKIQSIYYERKILEAGEMIYLENERYDRLDLKISELKNPARIIGKAENDLAMEISDNLKVMQIPVIKLNNVPENNNYIKNNIIADLDSAELKKYDNFLGTIFNIEDIIMVVSEGVLTFFIP